MGFFSSNKKVEVNEPGDMSPLEAVTHLFAAIQIADQQASFEEKESVNFENVGKKVINCKNIELEKIYNNE